MPKTLKVLITDEDEIDRRRLRGVLNHTGFACEFLESRNTGTVLAECEKHSFDCVFIDHRPPKQDGLAALLELHRQFPYLPVIMSTAHGDEMVAAEAMKRGAADYIPKGKVQPEPIRRCLENALEKCALRLKVAQQREQLENFSRVLVHDLKAPIQTVQSFALLMEQNIQEGTLENITDFCRRTTRAAARASALIETLYLYTRAEEDVVFEAVDMRQVMRDTLMNLNFAINERHARVTYDELPVVSGNAPQLTQLLQNLISNGIKYCKDPVPTVHVAAQAVAGQEWLFAVRDNGIGIPEPDCEQIFEPFKRLHGVDEYEGSGLGLATCKKVVERHQGRIWTESKQGLGTTLFFTLPGISTEPAPL